jgi:hypothetical protein
MSYYMRSELDLELADLLCEQFTPSTIGPSYERNGAWDMPPTLYGGCRFDRASLPFFSTDHNACAKAEAEIARRGLRALYVEELFEVLFPRSEHAPPWAAPYDGDGRDFAFALITAPPEARVRAMLAVLEEG